MKGSQPQIYAAYNAACIAQKPWEQIAKELEEEKARNALPKKQYEVSFRSKKIKESFHSKNHQAADSGMALITRVVIVLVAFIAICSACYFCS